MPDVDHIARINALTTNARNTWFVLLGALVFVGITLMGVEHIDFYGVDRATTLPLVSVDVPTPYFFVAAPILIAAIYGYFHLYLIRLWDALSDAEPTVNGGPLGDAIAPWLITDAALYLRTLLRDEAEPSARHRLLEGSAMALNFAIAWAFGLVVLFFLWWLSMPARTFWMTLIAGLSLLAAAFVGAASLALLVSRMRQKHTGPQGHVLATVPAMSALLVAVPFVLAFSHQRTEGSIGRLAPLSMVDQEIFLRPAGWVPYTLARSDFYESWCKREGQTCIRYADLDDERKDAFLNEFDQRRDIARSGVIKPRWSQLGATKPDFRGADLASAFLVGADLIEAQMEGADLSGAQMEGAVLFGAQMEGADLARSHLVGLTGRHIALSDTNLSAATNDAGALRFVDLSGATWDAETDFRSVFLDTSVTVPAEFRARMGNPCQWINAQLTDAEFYSLWRWWIGKTGNGGYLFVAPDYLRVPDPSPELLARYNLTDCEPDQPFGRMPSD